MSRQLKLSLLVLFGAIAIAVILFMLRPEPEEQEEVIGIPLVETAQYEVSSGAIEIHASGTVQPREEVALGTEVSGKLTYVNPSFREGSSISAGALLFRIDQSDYTNRVRSASADVAAQDVALLQAREEAAIAEAELRQFADRESTRTGLNRSIDSDDYAARILPPAEMNEGARPAQTSDPAEPNILATREPQLRSAEAARERAAAQLEDAQLALSRTEVRAPFSGVVRSESASIGTLVQPGQSMGSIVSTESFEVRISLSESEANLMPALFAPGRARVPAQIILDYGESSFGWPAFVDRVDPILDPETRTIAVFLRVPNPMRPGERLTEAAEDAPPGPPLLLGSFVSANITGVLDQKFAVIPIDALRTGNNVWVLSQGKLRVVHVQVIQRTDSFAYVSSPDLGAAGNVVVSSLSAPVDGMELRTSNVNDEAETDVSEAAAGE